jgi:hypothetical protein
MAGAEANQLVGALNKLMRYAVGLGVTASALQTSLYTGECLMELLAAITARATNPA